MGRKERERARARERERERERDNNLANLILKEEKMFNKSAILSHILDQERQNMWKSDARKWTASGRRRTLNLSSDVYAVTIQTYF